jgi:ABC-2 type transport system permease protein
MSQQLTSRVGAAAGRIGGMVLRHTYLMRKSWIRVVETAYWPTMNMILWGFIAKFLATQSTWVAQVPGLLISALLLWELMFRGQLSLCLAFLEELYARNLGNLFVSPLRPWEFVVSMFTVSLIRTAIGVGAAALLAWFLYAHSIFDMGFALIAFFVNLLVTGWGIGLMVCGLIMRYGLAAENFAWGLVFVAAPVSGVYYPIDVLPGWLQGVAALLPTSYVFEGMRAVLQSGTFRGDLFWAAAGLNVIYVAVGVAIFAWSFTDARRRGALLQVGE